LDNAKQVMPLYPFDGSTLANTWAWSVGVVKSAWPVGQWSVSAWTPTRHTHEESLGFARVGYPAGH
jgi:hypothetical protein